MTTNALAVVRPTSRTWVLKYARRPWTLNVERQTRAPWRRAELVKEWRTVFADLAREHCVPRLAAIEVTVMPVLKNRRSIPDTGACIGAAKAAIDGLVDAGVLEEDGPEFVHRLTFEAPRVTGDEDALLIRVCELEVIT